MHKFLSSVRGQELLHSNIVPEDVEIGVILTELNAHVRALRLLVGSDEQSSNIHVGRDPLAAIQVPRAHAEPNEPSPDHESVHGIPLASQSLSLHQESLETIIQQYRTILAPIRRIPAEILSHIFFQCLIAPAHHINYALPLTRGLHPWDLSYVCRQWRLVAVADPRLWASINVDYNGEKLGKSLVTEAPPPLELALQRSGSTSLDVTIIHGKTGQANSLPSLRVLMPHCARFRRLRIGNVGSDNLAVLSPLRSHLPELGELDLETWGFFEQTDIFEVALQLWNVSLKAPSPDSFILPWSQLTHFFWHGSSRYSGRDVDITCLGLMHSLESLELHCHRDIYELHPPALLPKLTSLVLFNYSKYADATPAIMNSLVVPALQHLKFSVYDSEFRCVGSLQRRCGFHLKHLKIDGSSFRRIDRDEWMDMFSVLGELTSLTMSDQNADCLASVLRISHKGLSGDDHHPVPALQTLHIVGRMSSADGFMAFLDMIAERASYAPGTSRTAALQSVILEVEIPPNVAGMAGRIWPEGLSFMNGRVGGPLSLDFDITI